MFPLAIRHVIPLGSVTGIVQGLRYATEDEFAAGVEPAIAVREALNAL